MPANQITAQKSAIINAAILNIDARRNKNTKPKYIKTSTDTDQTGPLKLNRQTSNQLLTKNIWRINAFIPLS
jgi:hypothetical protein